MGSCSVSGSGNPPELASPTVRYAEPTGAIRPTLRISAAGPVTGRRLPNPRTGALPESVALPAHGRRFLDRGHPVGPDRTDAPGTPQAGAGTAGTGVRGLRQHVSREVRARPSASCYWPASV